MKYEEIAVGGIYEFERRLTREDGERFVELTGDDNKLHLDLAYGQKSQFGQNIVHGMLAASLFSTLVGRYVAGEDGFYLSQTVKFRLPLFYDETVKVWGTVVAKNDSIKVITLRTEIIKSNSEIAISGEAKVRLIN